MGISEEALGEACFRESQREGQEQFNPSPCLHHLALLQHLLKLKSPFSPLPRLPPGPAALRGFPCSPGINAAINELQFLHLWT